MNFNSSKWQPVSSTAFGANAVYIPEYGQARTLEFILVMIQNYPEFKTHPALDVFHGYVKGAERFEENHEMRVLGWNIDLEKRQWSFIYLPTMRNDIRARVNFSASAAGSLRMEINMENPSAEDREWEFHLYCCPCEGLDLPQYAVQTISGDKCVFSLNGINMAMHSRGTVFKSMVETDSNFWINFPLNAESSVDPCNPADRSKKRLKISTQWIILPAGDSKQAIIDFFPDENMAQPVPAPAFSLKDPDAAALPYYHAIWEARHNCQYTRSLPNPDTMCSRPIPARQWGKFFIWDCGMTAAGLADCNPGLAEEIVAQMPDPEINGHETFNHGSYIVTAVYALWEIYRVTGNKDLPAKYYDKLKRLALRAFDTLPGEDYSGMAGTFRGSGADDNPSLFYAKGEIFAWDYKKTLPVNPDHSRKTLISVGLTCHAIRQLKILRIFAYILGLNDDVTGLSAKINTVEKELNENYWSRKYACYLERIIDEHNLLEIPWIFNYLPLFSGSAPDDRQRILFEKLFRKGGYFTTNGFMIVKPDSPYYRRDGYPNGSAWPPLQYFFWKACYGMGAMEAAREICDRYLDLFERNHKETLCVWEQFRAESGQGAGNMRFSGFVTPVVAMWKARRISGSVQTGYDVIVRAVKISSGNAELQLESPFYSGNTGISIVLSPDCGYTVRQNDKIIGNVKSDRFGWLGIAFKIDSGVGTRLNIKADAQ